MNKLSGKYRKWLIRITVAALVLMILLPPWTYTINDRASGSVFYQELIPGPKPPHCATGVTCGVKIDLGRLGIQFIVWAVIFGALIVPGFRSRAEE